MKLKCNDGVVRDFWISKISPYSGIIEEERCEHCKKPFGAHDTYILKPLFLRHTKEKCTKKE